MDVGYECSSGPPTGRLSIRVHVGKKKANETLALADRLPTELDGMPVDVIESNPQLDS